MTRRAARLVVLLHLTCGLPAEAQAPEGFADELKKLNTNLRPGDSTAAFSDMLSQHADQRIALAEQKSTMSWSQISTREQWEAFSRQRRAALASSLGNFPSVPGKLDVRVTKTLPGDGFSIENLVFESRPGLWVTANLYVPHPLRSSMPGILLCHSHHNPKTQGELQDMGMTWARAGCLVLVMDQIGHGERREHPFVSARDYATSFRVDRQDYHFRYNTGIQLHLIGDSLMGWMVWGLRRGVDLLLSRPGIDAARIILMGSVAGGGDPAAVTAALDERIAALVPFNFGGPQPETPYPLEDDAERSFRYGGSGSWESTRNLRLSLRDGFLPWLIVGSVAPRRLVYAHEFAWDRERDPVWKRLQKIYGSFYQAADRLEFTHGFGLLQGRPPEASHCNNIGAVHRRRIHQALNRWFEIPSDPDKEYADRRKPEELLCLTEELRRQIQPKPLRALALSLAGERILAARKELQKIETSRRTVHLRDLWEKLLGGNISPEQPRQVEIESSQIKDHGGVMEKVLLEIEPGIHVPLVLLRKEAAQAQPVVIGLSQAGKQIFVRERAEEIVVLLNRGIAVCLPDLRGTGETRPDDNRRAQSVATDLSSSELMLGRTLAGQRLRDLRSVMRHLRTHGKLDMTRVALWGESFAQVNPPGQDIAVPYGIEYQPFVSEPLGALLALLAPLFEKDVRAVYGRGGLVSFESVLSSPFVYLPHDAVVPGALLAGDLCDLAGALAPRPLKLVGSVDGVNRAVDWRLVEKSYEPALSAYQKAGYRERLILGRTMDPESPANWLSEALKTN